MSIHHIINVYASSHSRRYRHVFYPYICRARIVQNLRGSTRINFNFTMQLNIYSQLLCFQDVLTRSDSSKLKDEKNNQNNLHKVNLRNNQLKGNIILGNYGVS